MSEEDFLNSVYDVVAHLLQTELNITAKTLIRHYVNEFGGTPADKARFAVQRYTQIQISSLDEIRIKAERSHLDTVDHLVLKMEHEAKKLGSI